MRGVQDLEAAVVLEDVLLPEPWRNRDCAISVYIISNMITIYVYIYIYIYIYI